MKKFYQGTVDYACGIYAILNALALTHNVNLESARHIYKETIAHFSTCPTAWKAFLHNHTDHFWVVAYMLSRWCAKPPFKYRVRQPFSDCFNKIFLADTNRNTQLPFLDLPESLDNVLFYLPEEDPIQHDGQAGIIDKQTQSMWTVMEDWFLETSLRKRTAILRFHRFFPQLAQPVVSHWTTVYTVEDDKIILHDASADRGALLVIPKEDTLFKGILPPPVGLVPASLILLGT